MKKLVFCVCMFTLFQLHAQEFHFIPKVALNFSDLSKVKGSIKPGVTAGVAGEIKLSNSFVWNPAFFILYRE